MTMMIMATMMNTAILKTIARAARAARGTHTQHTRYTRATHLAPVADQRDDGCQLLVRQRLVETRDLVEPGETCDRLRCVSETE